MTATATVAHPFKVGDIFVNSWGWEQTNIDFYEVVAATAKSVKIARITSVQVPGSEGFMSARVVPGTGENRFVDGYGRSSTPVKTVTKFPYTFEWRGTDEWVIRFDHGSGNPHTEGTSYYCSWYA